MFADEDIRFKRTPSFGTDLTDDTSAILRLAFFIISFV